MKSSFSRFSRKIPSYRLHTSPQGVTEGATTVIHLKLLRMVINRVQFYGGGNVIGEADRYRGGEKLKATVFRPTYRPIAAVLIRLELTLS